MKLGTHVLLEVLNQIISGLLAQLTKKVSYRDFFKKQLSLKFFLQVSFQIGWAGRQINGATSTKFLRSTLGCKTNLHTKFQPLFYTSHPLKQHFRRTCHNFSMTYLGDLLDESDNVLNLGLDLLDFRIGEVSIKF